MKKYHKIWKIVVTQLGWKISIYNINIYNNLFFPIYAILIIYLSIKSAVNLLKFDFFSLKIKFNWKIENWMHISEKNIASLKETFLSPFDRDKYYYLDIFVNFLDGIDFVQQ
jgi:hypothetical protein